MDASIQEDLQLVQKFRQFIDSSGFPCVGAKLALKKNRVDIHLLDSFRCLNGVDDLLEKLQRFSRAYSPASSLLFQSFVIIFRDQKTLSEEEFEREMWGFLQRLHDMDRVDYQWDPDVSSDPKSPHFSFSIGARGYYIIGMHSKSARKSRQFVRPALVFNLHDQFERLRKDGRFWSMRGSITRRDIASNGSRNPMLTNHGEESEAREFSGRVVGPDWRCPLNEC